MTRGGWTSPTSTLLLVAASSHRVARDLRQLDLGILECVMRQDLPELVGQLGELALYWFEGSTLITTLPTFCPIPTYRYASTIWSNEYRLSITGLSSPDSISSFRCRTVAALALGKANMTFLPPSSGVMSSRIRY